jgi:hypothetical protein
MKQKDVATLIAAAVVSLMFALILGMIIFKGAAKKSQVPTAETINTSFPDVRNDPTYNSIFNSSALDPAQPIKVDNNNSQPFSGTQ